MRTSLIWAFSGTHTPCCLNFLCLLQELGGGAGSYPFASGLRYDIDYTAIFGNRISNLEVNPRVEADWAPIDPMMTYTVVTNSFIASGRDGYFTFISDGVVSSYIDTFIEYGQSFVNYAKAKQTLVELPLSEYSTQSLTMLDNTIYSVTDVDMDPTASPVESPTEEPAGDGATKAWGTSILTIIVLIAISFAGGL
jgi:hypothetical protein